MCAFKLHLFRQTRGQSNEQFLTAPLKKEKKKIKQKEEKEKKEPEKQQVKLIEMPMTDKNAYKKFSFKSPVLLLGGLVKITDFWCILIGKNPFGKMAGEDGK